MIWLLQLKRVDEETYLQSAEGVRFLPRSKSLLAMTEKDTPFDPSINSVQALARDEQAKS